MALDFPHIDPVAFSLGPLDIRWYALAYLAGFLLGWRYCLILAGKDPSHRLHGTDIDDFLPWAVMGVIVGGRLGYILFYNFGFYAGNPLEILKVWHGGMSFHGGALGVLAVMFLYAKRQGFSFLRLADIVACAAPIGLFFGRIANFVNGELYGRIAELPWAVKFPAGGFLPRHPSQLYEALLEGLALFLILALLAHYRALRDDRPGFLLGMFLLGYGAARSIVEMFREPDAQIGLFWNAFSMGQMLSVPMILAGLAVMIVAARKAP